MELVTHTEPCGTCGCNKCLPLITVLCLGWCVAPWQTHLLPVLCHWPSPLPLLSPSQGSCKDPFTRCPQDMPETIWSFSSLSYGTGFCSLSSRAGPHWIFSLVSRCCRTFLGSSSWRHWLQCHHCLLGYQHRWTPSPKPHNRWHLADVYVDTSLQSSSCWCEGQFSWLECLNFSFKFGCTSTVRWNYLWELFRGGHQPLAGVTRPGRPDKHSTWFSTPVCKITIKLQKERYRVNIGQCFSLQLDVERGSCYLVCCTNMITLCFQLVSACEK